MVGKTISHCKITEKLGEGGMGATGRPATLLCCALLTFALPVITQQQPSPREPTPYREEQLHFQSGDITLEGTLTLPPGAGPHPGIVLIAGSGPQDRDGTAFGFKPFRIMAGHFAREGIAVLRYDKRGVGHSKGSFSEATLQDFAGDAQAAVRILQSRPEVDPQRAGLCGHSEGGTVAAVAAAQSEDAAFLILLAAPGVDAERTSITQQERIARARGATDAEVEQAIDLQKRIFEGVRARRIGDELKAAMRKQLAAELVRAPEAVRKAFPKPDQLVDSEVRRLLSPAFRRLLKYDPALTFKEVDCPVLAVYGEVDLVTPSDVHGSAIARALESGGNRSYTLKTIPEANHYYLNAKMGTPEEFFSLKKEFAPGLLDAMTEWILKQAGKPRNE